MVNVAAVYKKFSLVKELEDKAAACLEQAKALKEEIDEELNGKTASKKNTGILYKVMNYLENNRTIKFVTAPQIAAAMNINTKCAYNTLNHAASRGLVGKTENRFFLK